MAKQQAPLRDLELVETVMLKLVYGGRKPPANQVEQAQAALKRLREHLLNQHAVSRSGDGRRFS